MPAHDAEATVGASIASVRRQTMPDFELVVVDDGSGDRTAEIVRAFGRRDSRIRLLEQENRGPSAARNAAIEAARGDLVSMIDSDDMWLATYLETMTAALDAESRAGFAYTDAWVLVGTTGVIRTRTAMAGERPPSNPPRDSRQFLDLLLERNFVFTAATVRRSVLNAVGGYDERLWFGEDYELWLRILEAGHEAVRVPGTLAIHRDSEHSLTSDLVRNIRGICTVYGTIVDEHELDDAQRGIALRRKGAWERRLAALERPSAVDRVDDLARRLVRRVVPRPGALKIPPDDVAATLAACEAESIPD